MSQLTTNFGPRVSFTTSSSAVGVPVHVEIPSHGTFTAAGTNLITGAATFSGGAQIGSGATAMNITSLNKSVISVSMGAVTGHESATTSGTIVGITTDSVVIAMEPQSAWSGAYYDINYSSVISVADTVDIIMTNSAVTDITPANMNFTFIWVDPA